MLWVKAVEELTKHRDILQQKAAEATNTADSSTSSDEEGEDVEMKTIPDASEADPASPNCRKILRVTVSRLDPSHFTNGAKAGVRTIQLFPKPDLKKKKCFRSLPQMDRHPHRSVPPSKRP